jgi:hypothetical protein
LHFQHVKSPGNALSAFALHAHWLI